MKIILDATNNPHHQALNELLAHGLAHAVANKMPGQAIKVVDADDGDYTGLSTSSAGHVLTIELTK
jgi:hypothetical protein